MYNMNIIENHNVAILNICDLKHIKHVVYNSFNRCTNDEME